MPKERITGKMTLETESLSLESSVISNGQVDREPSDIMMAMMDKSSKGYFGC